jgi:phosphohistidine phosphatase
VRHGEAEPKTSGKRDEDRRLTKTGSVRLRNGLIFVKEYAGVKMELILSSPVRRSKESAEIAKEIFPEAKLEVSDLLMPGSTPYELLATLSRYNQLERIMLVSHQPLVSRLLSGLLNWNDRYFSFGPGAIAVVELEEVRENAEGVLRLLIQ